MTTGFDPPLIIAAVVGAVLAVACALRVVLVYGHPDDSRAAWWPRAVATLAFALAAWTVLLLPLDVASRRACDAGGVTAAACGAAVPAAALWRAIAVAGAVVAFAVVPVAYFYYLGDSDDPPSKRVLGALAWAAATAAVAGGALGLAYAFGGVADVPVTVLASGFVRANAALPPAALDACVAPPAGVGDPPLPTTPRFAGRACDAVTGRSAPTLWSVRVTLPTYVLALQATAGWALFLVFGGVGLVLWPADAIIAFTRRPRATIGRAEYAKRAAALGARAAAVRAAGQRLRAEGRAGGRARALAAATARLAREVAVLEDDAAALEAVHPRGENAAAAWAVTVAGHWAGLGLGVGGAALTAALFVHLALAVFPRPPVSPALDAALAALDDAVPLLGTAAFGGICFHLVAATIKGAAAVGSIGFGLLPSHPLRRGATHASSLLFNGGLVLLASAACVQFAAAAFAGYVGGSAVGDAWGGTLTFLRGLRVLYQRAAFLYALAGVAAATCLVLPCRGAVLARARRERREGVF